MKKILLSLLLIWGAGALALPITLASVILTKDSTANKSHFLANRTLAEWCSGFAHGIQLGSFQAAADFEALADGLYTCPGQFATLPGQGAIQIFALGGCHLEDPAALHKTCP